MRLIVVFPIIIWSTLLLIFNEISCTNQNKLRLMHMLHLSRFHPAVSQKKKNDHTKIVNDNDFLLNFTQYKCRKTLSIKGYSRNGNDKWDVWSEGKEKVQFARLQRISNDYFLTVEVKIEVFDVTRSG